jgi:hypothetical protein
MFGTDAPYKNVAQRVVFTEFPVEALVTPHTEVQHIQKSIQQLPKFLRNVCRSLCKINLDRLNLNNNSDDSQYC